jgi:hypothetical protein
LKPGGVMIFDDVKSAFNMLARKYDLKQYFLLESTKKQGYIIKKDEERNVRVERGMTSIRSQSKMEPNVRSPPVAFSTHFDHAVSETTIMQ